MEEEFNTRSQKEEWHDFEPKQTAKMKSAEKKSLFAPPVSIPRNFTMYSKSTIQELPCLYGWGADPAQKIMRSTEVVGINAAGQTGTVHSSLRKSLDAEALKAEGFVSQRTYEFQSKDSLNPEIKRSENKIFYNASQSSQPSALRRSVV